MNARSATACIFWLAFLSCFSISFSESSESLQTYIIHLRADIAPPVLVYDGSISGFPATSSPTPPAQASAPAPTVDHSSPGSASPAPDADVAHTAAFRFGGNIGKIIRGKINEGKIIGSVTKIRERVRSRLSDVGSSHVRSYVSWLKSYHLKIAEEVGVKLSDVFHSYTFTTNAFAARLTGAQVRRLQRHNHVAYVQRDRVVTTQETYAPQFINVKGAVWPAAGGQSNAGQGVVIGIIDTGIWPEHPSFSDATMPKNVPIPSYWKGKCNTTGDFPASSCNKKVIGARYFVDGFLRQGYRVNAATDFKSPRDGSGHGSWCAGAAAGKPNTVIAGYGFDSGMAPGAFLAIYKALWVVGTGGTGSYVDILAAVDQAVADGCDVISLSLGGGYSSYFDDVAYLRAAKAGVFAALAAGNSGSPYSTGPFKSTLSNAAPFYMTVAASNMDRRYNAQNQPVYDQEAPALASFSSQGPLINPSNPSQSPLTNSILKPDVMGPGKDLWGSWRTGRVGAMAAQQFAMSSGTSMATPLLAGVAAVIIQKYPSWSPAQVKSAMMTTATITTNRGNPITRDGTRAPANPWGFGAGAVNGTKLLDPGLTFDVSYTDYVNFLGGINANRARNFFGAVHPMIPYQLNLPSIVATRLRGSITIPRVATNVASVASFYRATVVPPAGVTVVVRPMQATLYPGKNFFFNVTLSTTSRSTAFNFGTLTWTDYKGHSVRCILGVQGSP